MDPGEGQLLPLLILHRSAPRGWAPPCAHIRGTQRWARPEGVPGTPHELARPVTGSTVPVQPRELAVPRLRAAFGSATASLCRAGKARNLPASFDLREVTSPKGKAPLMTRAVTGCSGSHSRAGQIRGASCKQLRHPASRLPCTTLISPRLGQLPSRSCPACQIAGKHSLGAGWSQPSPNSSRATPSAAKPGCGTSLGCQHRAGRASAPQVAAGAWPCLGEKSLAGRKERSCPPAGHAAPTALSSESRVPKPCSKQARGRRVLPVASGVSSCRACSESLGALLGCLLSAVLQARGSAPAAPSPGGFSPYACRGDLPSSHVLCPCVTNRIRDGAEPTRPPGLPGQGREARGRGNDPQHRLTLSQGSAGAAKPPGRDAAGSCPGWQRNPESLFQAGEPLETQTRPLACVCLVCQLGLWRRKCGQGDFFKEKETLPWGVCKDLRPDPARCRLPASQR